MAKGRKTRSKTTLGIAIVGGGAGGHVYPGIAVAKEIKRQFSTARVLFVGTKKGIEGQVAPQEGFSFEAIEMYEEKNRRRGTRLKSFMRLPKAVRHSIKVLKKFHPSVVLGIGGSVAVPVIYAAYLLRVPTVIFESNRQPGLAHRLLSHSVDKIAVCFDESTEAFPKKKVINTGNPVRREFFLIGETPPPDKGRKLNVLVIAGALGTRSINYSTIAALDYLKDYQDRLVFTHQSGDADLEYVKSGYEKRTFRADVYAYINDIPKMYAKSHLVISRAGSSTVAELKASGRLAILIPYPYDSQDQEYNALALKDAGMAKIIAQKQFSGRSLAEEIHQVLEYPEEFAQVWPNSRRLKEQDATEKLVRTCLQLASGGNDSYEIGI